MRPWILGTPLIIFIPFIPCFAQLETEIYQTCTAYEGARANCGPGANCFIIDNMATCHCVVDVATGFPLAGNPYRACTWDVSGSWQLFSYQTKAGFVHQILSPISNEPFVVRFDRTDAVLKTRYMTGALFMVTALTSFSAGVCARVLVDVNDNVSIMFEWAEGFLGQKGRSIFLRTLNADTTLVKRWPKKYKIKDEKKISGKWMKNDGSRVKIAKMKKPKKYWPGKKKDSYIYMQKASYWYNDDSFGAPLVRLSMAAWLDETLPSERIAYNTNARFIQVGWYGALRMGATRVDVYSPADGKDIFMLQKLDTTPPYVPVGMGTSLGNAFQPRTTQIMGQTPVTLTFDQETLQDLADQGLVAAPGTEEIPDTVTVDRVQRSYGGQSTGSRYISNPVRRLARTNDTDLGSICEDGYCREGMLRRLGAFAEAFSSAYVGGASGSVSGDMEPAPDGFQADESRPYVVLWEMARDRLQVAEEIADNSFSSYFL